jgi:serine/threonine protein kinase
LKQLATGSVADVLLARASGLEGFARHVVIKRIHPDLAREERFVSAFVEEARIAASLHHQNIVQVHDIGDEGGSIYFAMEYVHGEDCRKLLNRLHERREVMPLQHVVSIVMATAAGLHYAHEQTMPSGENKGIVHRDVSPANILIGYDGSVKLVDFGLAKAASRSTNATSSGTLKGKSSYMSPEQCTGKPLDRRTDTFSLGIVLFELLTAQRLFKGINEFMTMAAIVDGVVPRPSTLRADVPAALDEIVLRALAREPDARYQTAESLRESLEAFALAQELRTSNKSLSDYMVTLFGERPEPWLAPPSDEPAWEPVDVTHSGLVVMPRDPKGLIERYRADTESPLMQARATDNAEWSDDDEHVATAGQLPSLRRMEQTEPTPTVRKPSVGGGTVNANVLRRESDVGITPPPPPAPLPMPLPPPPPPAPPKPSSSPAIQVSPHVVPRSEVGKSDDISRKFNEPTAVRHDDDDLDGGGATKLMTGPDAQKFVAASMSAQDTTSKSVQLPPSKPADTQPTATLKPLLETTLLDPTATAIDIRKAAPADALKKKDDVPGSSTVVEPPIFDGGLRARDDDDDGLDDEPATEISLDVPEHIAALRKDKHTTPTPTRRPVDRADTTNDELPRAQAAIPPPLRPAARVHLPRPTGTMGSVGPRENTAPPAPMAPPAPVAPPMPPPPRPTSFAGVDPAAVAAGFQQMPRGGSDVLYPGGPAAPLAEHERVSGFAAGKRTLFIVGISVSIIVVTLVAMRSCDGGSTSRSAAPADAEVEIDAASAKATPATTRPDAVAAPAADRGDPAADDRETKSVAPPTKRTLPKRPKGIGTR